MMTSRLLKGTNFSSWQKQGATEFFPKLFCSQISKLAIYHLRSDNLLGVLPHTLMSQQIMNQFLLCTNT